MESRIQIQCSCCTQLCCWKISSRVTIDRSCATIDWWRSMKLNPALLRCRRSCTNQPIDSAALSVVSANPFLPPSNGRLPTIARTSDHRWYSTVYWDFTQSLLCPTSTILTPPADHNYNLRDRPHKRQLPDRTSHLTNCNFTVQMLFCGSYWLYWLYGLHLLSCFLSVSLYYCGLTIVLLKKSWFWSTAHRPRAQGKSVNRANTAFYLWQFWLRELFSGTNRETLKSQVTISAWWRSSSGVELSIKRSWVRYDPRPRSSQGT